MASNPRITIKHINKCICILGVIQELRNIMGGGVLWISADQSYKGLCCNVIRSTRGKKCCLTLEWLFRGHQIQTSLAFKYFKMYTVVLLFCDGVPDIIFRIMEAE